MASFTMKHALLCSSTIQGGGKRRASNQFIQFSIIMQSLKFKAAFQV